MFLNWKIILDRHSELTMNEKLVASLHPHITPLLKFKTQSNLCKGELFTRNSAMQVIWSICQFKIYYSL